MSLWSSSEQKPARRVLPWLLGITFVLVLVLAFVAYRQVAPADALDLPENRRLAVLPLQNATGEGDQAWVRLGLMEMISETLARTPGLEIVTAERLVQAVDSRELLADSEEIRRRIRELAAALGGELFLDVRIHRRTERRSDAGGEPYLLELAVLDATGTVLDRTTLRGSDPARLGGRLAFLVADSLTARDEPIRFSQVYGSSTFLNRLHGMGLAVLATDGPAAARPYFEIAVDADPRFLAARLRLAEIGRREGRWMEARQRAIEVVEAAQSRGERAWERRALHELARTEAIAGRLPTAVEMASQVRALAARAGKRSEELSALRDLVRFALGDGDDERAAELLAERLALEEGLGDRLGKVETLSELGALALRSDDLETARARLEEGGTLAGELGDVWSEMRILASLGEVAKRQGDHERAVEAWRRAAVFASQRGQDDRLLLLRKNIAESLLLGHDLKAAEEAFLDVLDSARDVGDRRLQALASVRLAYILLRRGYPYQARPHLDRAIAFDQDLDEPLTLQRLISWMAYEEGNYDLALRTLLVVKRQAGDGWGPLDEGFLKAYETALERGERVRLPGEEEGVLGPG